MSGAAVLGAFSLPQWVHVWVLQLLGEGDCACSRLLVRRSRGSALCSACLREAESMGLHGTAEPCLVHAAWLLLAGLREGLCWLQLQDWSLLSLAGPGRLQKQQAGRGWAHIQHSRLAQWLPPP